MRDAPTTLRLAAVTTCRSDFGRMAAIYHALQDDTRVVLHLVAGGAHFLRSNGHSIDEVRASGLALTAELAPRGGEAPLALAADLIVQLGETLDQLEPDYLLLLGDRHELLGCALAALHLRVPIIHIGGGHVTEGAIDDSVRQALSKLAVCHLVANEGCAEQLRQLGEVPDRIHLVGAPDLDMVRLEGAMTREELLPPLGLQATEPFVLVTIHPETRDPFPMEHLDAAFQALMQCPLPLLITGPAPDPGHRLVMKRIDHLLASRRRVHFHASLGKRRYINALRYATAVVGNSSSGILEASILPVPVVDIGRRQEGRPRGRQVIHASWSRADIEAAIKLAISPAFRQALASEPFQSPYGDGHASERIVEVLVGLPRTRRTRREDTT